MAERIGLRHIVGIARERRLLEALGHRRPHEPRLHRGGDEALRAIEVIEALEIRGQARLGGSVDHHGLASAFARDRGEGDQTAAAPGQETDARFLAEQDGVGEVRGEHGGGAGAIAREFVLGAEEPGAQDHGVEAAESRIGRFQRGAESGRGHQVAQARSDGRSAPHLQILRALREIVGIPAEDMDLFTA